MRRRFPCSAMVIFFSLSASGICQEPRSDEKSALDGPEKTLAKRYLTGMWTSIETVQAGVVEISDGPATFTFNRPLSLIRYDYNGRLEWGSGSRVVSKPSEVIEYIVGRGVVTRHHPPHALSSKLSEPPDLALIGLLTLPEWQYKVKREQYSSGVESLFEVESETEGVVILLATSSVSPPNRDDVVYTKKRRLHLDKKRGLVPTRLDVQSTAVGVPYQSSLVSTTSWELVDSILVPVRCEMVSENSTAGKVASEKRTIDFKWSKLNSEPEPTLFEPNSIATVGDAMVDYRHDPPLRETIGLKSEFVAVPDLRLGSNVRRIILSLNAAIIALVVGALSVREFRKRRRIGA